MKYNMKQWLDEYLKNPVKKPLPIMSFPGFQLIGHTVEELVRSGELQAQCMKAVADRFDTGVSFSLMDLSVEAEAFGSKIRYFEDEVPTIIETLVHNENDADNLQVPKVGAARTGECVKGIKLASEMITDRPVIAGMIGPYSLAGRLMDINEVMVLCYEEPEMVETVLEKVTEFLIEYAKAFKEAGANGVAMAEPVAGLLSPNLIKEFSNPYVQKIKDAVEDENFVLIYHNCGNIVPLLNQVKEIDAKVYSVGNAIDIEESLKVLQEDAIVMGNIDPAGTLRNGTPEQIRKETLELMERCGKYPNFVIASGCDMPPLTPMENIEAFFAAVNDYYAGV